MRDKSRDQISELSGHDSAACDLHGRAWTGVPVAASEDSGDYAVLQYIHPDFEQVTESHLQAFAGEKLCHKCGDPTEPIPLWAVERILKAHPYLVLKPDFLWEGICYQCAHDSECSNCKGEDEDDEHEDDGWQSQPYCQ